MRRIKVSWIAVLTAVLLLAASTSALAALVSPVRYEGPGGGNVDWDCDYQVKFDSDELPADGDSASKQVWIDSLDGYITVSVYRTSGIQYFDFDSDFPVLKVAAKGSNASNIYDYTGLGYEVFSDTGLHAPENASGSPADLSNIVFCFTLSEEPPPTPPVEPNEVSGAKFYDRDMDGEWDNGEPALEGWPITITGLEFTDTVLTDEDGEFSFTNVPLGDYVVSEAAAPEGSGWMQTKPEDPGHFEVTVEEGSIITGLDFGNVYQTTTTNGRTLGFWSNKNGKVMLDGTAGAWMTLLAGRNLVNKSGAPYDPTGHGDFRNWLLRADATNMSYMLSAQFAATILNTNYGGANYGGVGVVVDGDWTSIADVMSMANAFLGANPITRTSGPLRMRAEFLKDIMDGLNNNSLLVIPYDPPALPF